MLISIKRYIRNSDSVREILINTNFIVKIEPVENLETQIHSRILMEGFGENELDMIYTTYDLPYIKGLLTKVRNANNESSP